MLARVEEIVGEAERLIAVAPAGEAFFRFFAYMVGQATANRGLAEALAGRG